MSIYTTVTVAQLAAEHPGAARLFEQLGIDYCCGGARSLQEACATAGVPVEKVVRSLEEASLAQATAGDFKNWQEETLGALISHIIGKHHVYTKAELERLEQGLAKVCSVHGETHPELLRIEGVFKQLKNELLTHMFKEEQVLFPYLIEMEAAVLARRPIPPPFFGTVSNPIRMMMFEHDSAGEALRRVRELSSDYTVPDGACASYQTLYQALEALEQDLHQHIHLENNILFPRAEELERGR